MKALLLSALIATNVNAYEINLSNSADRSNSIVLSTPQVKQGFYIYVTPENNVKSVEFYVDNLTTPVKVETVKPYDLGGTAANGTAMAYDFSKLSEGPHTIYVTVKTVDGKTETKQATIIVPKAEAQPTPSQTPQASQTPKPTTPPTSSGQYKWHPGHYAFAPHPKNVNQEAAQAVVSQYITGVTFRYKWYMDGIEKDDGSYDFSLIESNLAYLKSKNKRLGILMFEQDYWGQNCVPLYMRTDPKYKGGQFKSGNRCVPKYWVPAVMDRVIALYTAMGKKFDTDPAVEFINTGETAAGLAASSSADFSKQEFVNQLKRFQVALATAWPHTVSLMGLNFAPNIAELVDNAYKVGVGIGGPDLTVYPPFTLNGKTHSASEGYPFYKTYRGKMAMEIGTQEELEDSFLAGRSIEQAFNFGVRDPNGLQVNYMDWGFPYRSNTSFKGTILPYVEQQKGFMANTKCPENLVKRGGCDTR